MQKVKCILKIHFINDELTPCPRPPSRRKKQDNPYDQTKMGHYNLFSAAQGIHIVFTYREGKGTNV